MSKKCAYPFDVDAPRAEQGMHILDNIVIPEGSYIYRFSAETGVDNLGYHASPWWVLESDFEDIARRATARGYDLGMMARWDLAVLYKWSIMNVVIQARVRDHLRAWVGSPKPQRECTPTGKWIRMMGNGQVKQLYLCGLTDAAGMLTAHGRNVLSITGAKLIKRSTAT